MVGVRAARELVTDAAVIPDMLDIPDGEEMRTHPEILRVFRDGIRPDMAARGFAVRIESAARSLAEQRTKYIAYTQGRGGRAAPPGRSAHNYGLAIDVLITAVDGVPLLDPYRYALHTLDGRRAYDMLHQVAKRYNLAALAQADDPFHLQAPNWRQLAGVVRRYPSFTR